MGSGCRMMKSCEAFMEVKAGTKFLVCGQRYLKLSPTGREITRSCLARLSDGLIVCATELWNMQEIRESEDLAFFWEKDILCDPL